MKPIPLLLLCVAQIINSKYYGYDFYACKKRTVILIGFSSQLKIVQKGQ